MLLLFGAFDFVALLVVVSFAASDCLVSKGVRTSFSQNGERGLLSSSVARETRSEKDDVDGDDADDAYSDDPQVVVLADGTALPVWEVKQPPELPPPSHSDESPSVLVFGHGLLGNSSHVLPMLEESLHRIAKRKRRVDSMPSLLAYDARGHGKSSGWEGGGLQQFHWRALAVDMLQVASAGMLSGSGPAKHGGFILGGQSMGANTALWAALLSPRAVKGLVLMQITTAWELRDNRKANLKRKAKKAERRGEDGKSAVLQGAALCELPPKEDLRRIRVPALIVASKDDPTHPSEMAQEVAELLPNANLVLVEHKRDIQSKFSRELAAWMAKHAI